MNFLPVIKNAQLFDGISDAEIQEVLDCLDSKTQSYKKDEYILKIGDSVSSIGLMLKGNALIVKEDFWGNRNIVSDIKEGQTFAETFACVINAEMSVNVIAQTDCTVLFLNIERVLTACSSACIHHSKIIRNLLLDISSKNIMINEKLTHMGQRTTRAKLLSYLSWQAQKQGGSEFDIPFSRQQLADYLSVDRSGLSSELCKMRDEGLLLFNKNHFKLL